MAKLWISGDTNIKSMKEEQNEIAIELIQEDRNLNEEDVEYRIDLVKIPKSYISRETFNTILDQLLTNDLKYVGYEYSEEMQKQSKPFKTMYKTQVRGTLNILLHELAS
jgi:hypothetical protein